MKSIFAAVLGLPLIVSATFSCRAPDEAHTVFGIYTLADSTLGASVDSLADLELNPTPWLSDRDIDFYDFSTHCIYLKRDKGTFPAGAGGARSFVVVAGGERCYKGLFISMLSSLGPGAPHFTEMNFQMDGPMAAYAYDSRMLFLRRGWLGPDTRDDPRVKSALMEAGLLHEGLAIELLDVRVLDTSGEEATVECTYRLTNRDRDALYVLDPGKAGKQFHYYTHGVRLRDVENPRLCIYKARHADFDKDAWSRDWYTRMPSGASMEWTTRKVTDAVPPGTYSCSMVFSGPLRVGGDARRAPDGRIWLGAVESNPLTLEVGS